MPDPVILLHGLGRTGLSMVPLARALRRAGFAPEVVDYPSRKRPIADLVETVLAPRVEARLGAGAERVHFVTHSLGGVLARALAAARFDAGHPLPEGSRAVMLAPPHAGSEVADALRHRQPFKAALGPVLQELGTEAESVPNRLGDVRGIEAGVLIGTRRLLPFDRYFDGPNDGNVSVASALAPDGLADTGVVRPSHALIMVSPRVIRLTLRFLRTGSFGDG
ncbi:MAG: alpha/beta fold hydrolase [Bacteroidota bacterium]